MMQPQGPQQIQIELEDAVSEGTYANLAMIMHSPNEIVLDFARVVPRSPKAKVKARIIMTPMHAKILLKTLEDNLKNFEKQFGEIKMHVSPDKIQNPIGFESSSSDRGED
ncbi:MAG TPA: DUF3467 domain-containing protein [candidate division Zixibacteria bacterium]|nr:DUF3467 domain-containing protein [candidate division Zixibacteria bacterium]